MRDTLYDAHPQRRSAATFLREAAGDLRQSPEIAYRLFQSNLKARYRGSLLGYVWLVLPALATAATCAYLAAHRVIAVNATAAPYPLFVLCGVCLWQVFVEALNMPLQQLNASRPLITRSRVPHEAVLLAGVMMIGLNAAIRLALIVVALLVFGVSPGPSILLAPLGMATMVVLGIAVGLLITPLGLLFDDVGRGLMLATGFWFFLTPIVYPLPADGLFAFNPVTPLLSTTRSWLISGGRTEHFMVMALIAFAGLLATWIGYRLARPHCVARLG